MYVEGKDKDAVESWVSVVKNLRYKDFQLASRPASATVGDGEESRGPAGVKWKRGEMKNERHDEIEIGLEEVESVKEFGNMMEQKGVWQWWRRGMGYVH